MWVLRFLVFALAASAAGISHSQESAAAPYLPAIVQILARDKSGNVSSGSAFMLKGFGLVTAYHVVHGAQQIWADLPDHSIAHANIAAYHEGRDLAVLNLLGTRKPPGELVGALAAPERLTSKQGLVLGHPDSKRDFAIHVSFPWDGTYPAGKWSSSGASGNTPFSFANGDLQLIVLNGTLNRGMSGGPVIVEGRVIGVFSGGEQRSGAGLAWAIPLHYLGDLKPNARQLPGSELPKLTMLSDSSAPLSPFKRAGAGSASALLAIQIELAATGSEFQSSLRAYHGLLRDTVSKCRNFGESPKTDQDRSRRVECFEVFLTGFSSSESVAIANAVAASVEPFTAVVARAGPALHDSLETQILSLTASDLSSGYLRRLKDAAGECKAREREFRQVLPMLGSAARQFASAQADAVEDLKAAHNRGELTTPEGSQTFLARPSILKLVESMQSVESATLQVADQGRDLQKDLEACLTRVAQVLESRGPGNMESRVALDSLSETEQAFLGGLIIGVYASTDKVLSVCEDQTSADARRQMEESHFKWRQRWFPILRKAQRLAPEANSAVKQAEPLLDRSLRTLPSGFLGQCANLAEKALVYFGAGDSLRLAGFLRLFGVDVPAVGKTASIHNSVTELFTQYATARLMRDEALDLKEVEKFARPLTLLVLNEALEREIDQCIEFHPPLASKLTAQQNIWRARKKARLESLTQDVVIMLTLWSKNKDRPPVQIAAEFTERGADVVRELLREQVPLAAADHREICSRMSEDLATEFEQLEAATFQTGR